VQIAIEDNTGWQYSGREKKCYRSDSKHFARTLLDTLFWNAVGHDGVCSLCNWSVQFILRRDPDGYFRFAAMQSPIGQHFTNG
jgi:hypothetical protein